MSASAAGSGQAPGSDAARSGSSSADSGPASRPDAGTGDVSATGSASGSRPDDDRDVAAGSGSTPGDGVRGGEASDGAPSDANRGEEAPATGSGRGAAASAPVDAPGSRPDAVRGQTSGTDAPPITRASGAGERRTGESWASGAAAGDSRPASAWATGASASGSSTEHRPSEAGARPVDQPYGVPNGSAATEPPVRDDQATTRAPLGGSSAVSGHDLFAAQEGASQHGGSAFPLDDAEPPEESPDPALARVAASVEDEVLVVDEQPRYHLVGCRALAAQQTIPLPAREAVELGFTPCGWCNPVAGLGARHPASAR